MGESSKRQETAVAQASGAFVAVQTMGGRKHVRRAANPRARREALTSRPLLLAPKDST
ncbi:MAG: hypothetical protein ACKVP1_09145 [Burkholderiaceae bacterium]